jgi:hypothetical protein
MQNWQGYIWKVFFVYCTTAKLSTIYIAVFCAVTLRRPVDDYRRFVRIFYIHFLLLP